MRDSHKAQLPTHHCSIDVIPAIITYTAPLTVNEDLHTTLFTALSIHQPYQGTFKHSMDKLEQSILDLGALFDYYYLL